MLRREEIPQANSVHKLIDLARHVADGGEVETAPGFNQPRDRDYYAQALRILGLFDTANALTETGRAMALGTPHEALDRFRSAVAASTFGRRWLESAGVATVLDLTATSASPFLAKHSDFSPDTRERRASGLRSWLKVLQARQLALSIGTPVDHGWP
jgi:HrpA-like RNA helicase